MSRNRFISRDLCVKFHVLEGLTSLVSGKAVMTSLIKSLGFQLPLWAVITNRNLNSVQTLVT